MVASDSGPGSLSVNPPRKYLELMEWWSAGVGTEMMAGKLFLMITVV